MNRLAFLAALLPLTACGDILYDQNQRRLILEPVERVVFDVDNGSVEIFTFDRTAISILYYLRGSGSNIEDVEVDLLEGDDGHEILAFIKCGDDLELCIADFYCETPLGTPIDATIPNGGLKLIGVDAPVTATTGTGATGIHLAIPTLDLEVAEGDVTLAYEAAPQSIEISVAVGNVDLTLPAGSYRCDLDAADGDVDPGDITCDDAATSTLEISVASGNITLQVAS